jgi:hypothetical protein
VRTRDGFGDSVGKRLSATAFDERDDRAAETAAGHPRGDGARRVGAVDEVVELGGRYFEVVAQALVARTEQRAKTRNVASVDSTSPPV